MVGIASKLKIVALATQHVVLNMWSQDQQQQPSLGAYLKCTFSVHLRPGSSECLEVGPSNLFSHALQITGVYADTQ